MNPFRERSPMIDGGGIENEKSREKPVVRFCVINDAPYGSGVVESTARSLVPPGLGHSVTKPREPK